LAALMTVPQRDLRDYISAIAERASEQKQIARG
jgi:hypothetical protein